jgi:hypothetical protein
VCEEGTLSTMGEIPVDKINTKMSCGEGKIKKGNNTEYAYFSDIECGGTVTLANHVFNHKYTVYVVSHNF